MNLDTIIKENPNINITVNASDLMEFGKCIASQTAQTILKNHEEKIYTRNEMIEKFGICSATAWRWTKLGLIQGKKIVIRLYYPES